jgi:GTP cyclohydrolase II
MPPETMVKCLVRTRIPIDGAVSPCYLHLYNNTLDSKQHLAIVFDHAIRPTSLDAEMLNESIQDRLTRGALIHSLPNGSHDMETHPKHASSSSSAENIQEATENTPLVRIHSECFTGETLGSVRCDCGDQLSEAIRLMSQSNNGIIVYLRQEGRGIGLLDKLRAYNLQDLGHDTVAANLLLNHPPDLRSYTVASLILKDLKISKVRLLTNNPDKIEQMEAVGIKVTERVGMIPRHWTKGISNTKETRTRNFPLTCQSRSSSRLGLPPEMGALPKEMNQPLLNSKRHRNSQNYIDDIDSQEEHGYTSPRSSKHRKCPNACEVCTQINFYWYQIVPDAQLTSSHLRR